MGLCFASSSFVEPACLRAKRFGGSAVALAEAETGTENREPGSLNGMNHTLTTTAFTIDGYRIVQNRGVVRGIIVRSRSIFGTIGGSLQTLVGGNITLFTDLCERTRADAFNQMLEHAQQLGANAVIGIRYDATEILNSVTEVLCYGTAVVVEPVSGGHAS